MFNIWKPAARIHDTAALMLGIRSEYNANAAYLGL